VGNHITARAPTQTLTLAGLRVLRPWIVPDMHDQDGCTTTLDQLCEDHCSSRTTRST